MEAPRRLLRVRSRTRPPCSPRPTGPSRRRRPPAPCVLCAAAPTATTLPGASALRSRASRDPFPVLGTSRGVGARWCSFCLEAPQLRDEEPSGASAAMLSGAASSSPSCPRDENRSPPCCGDGPVEGALAVRQPVRCPRPSRPEPAECRDQLRCERVALAVERSAGARPARRGLSPGARRAAAPVAAASRRSPGGEVIRVGPRRR